MAGSSGRAARVVLALLSVGGLLSCTVGTGDSDLHGTLTVPRCGKRDVAYGLGPTFFAADTFDNLLQVRLQRGSDLQSLSDGVWIYIADAAFVRTSLGVPIPLTTADGAPVKATLYLGASCPTEFWQVPVLLEARSGTVTFDHIYVPTDPAGDPVISATLRDVSWVGLAGEHSDLAGFFRFRFVRSRPAQHFPQL